MPRMTKAEKERIAAESKAALAKRQGIVASRRCPDCGSGLKYNCTIRGWWQCEQYGNPEFRARPAEKGCSFQVFV